MQYNYDFHLHHQLVDASQMLQEFEIFYDSTNVHSVYGMTAGISSEWDSQLLLWSSFTMVYTLKFKEKDFWLFSKKLMGKGENFCFSIPSPRKPRDLCQAKPTLWSFYNTSWLDIWTFWLLFTLCSVPRGL